MPVMKRKCNIYVNEFQGVELWANMIVAGPNSNPLRNNSIAVMTMAVLAWVLPHLFYSLSL